MNKNITTLNDAIAYISNTDWNHSSLGLVRITTLLKRLGNPQDSLKFIHIAGTNGKGSTAAMTASILQKAGYKTGLYTSPYLHVFNERMRIDGLSISDSELADITQYVKLFADKMDDHPTEFELITVIAFLYFKQNGCDFVVLEVGLGGRLDATNVITKSEVSVITAIGIDHTAQLGNTLPLIAKEKAGIIKPNCPVVLYRQEPEIIEVVKQACTQNDAQLYITTPNQIVKKSHDLQGQTFDYNNLKDIYISLLGEHQLKNAATVLTIIEVLNQKGYSIPQSSILDGFKAARWAGRFELLRQNPDFIVDGGHNPQCMLSVLNNMQEYYNGKKAVILTGVMADKAYAEMYDILQPVAAAYVTVCPDNARALPAEKLAEFLKSQYEVPVFSCENIQDGIQNAIHLAQKKDTLVLAVGSLYMCGDIRTYFGFDICSGLF